MPVQFTNKEETTNNFFYPELNPNKKVEEAIEEAFLELIDYTPRSKVEICFKNTSKLSFLYWTAPEDFLKFLKSFRGNKVTLIACERQIISFNKKDILYKVVSEVFEKEG